MIRELQLALLRDPENVDKISEIKQNYLCQYACGVPLLMCLK